MIFLLGCIPQSSFQTVMVTGQVQTEGSGPLQGELHYARSEMTDLLSHPGGYLETLSFDEDGAFELTLAVPLGLGSGLAAYAWQDSDEDGLLCGLGADNELSGADVVEQLDFEVDFDIWLTEPCAGAEVVIASALGEDQL